MKQSKLNIAQLTSGLQPMYIKKKRCTRILEWKKKKKKGLNSRMCATF